MSRRERVLAFTSSVVLCCILSGSISLIAKKSRNLSAVSTGTARMATPYDDTSSSVSQEAEIVFYGPAATRSTPGIMETYSNNVIGVKQHPQDHQEINEAIRTPETPIPVSQSGLSGNIVTGAILCLVAAMCCAITALGAQLLLRGPRRRKGAVSAMRENGDFDHKEHGKEKGRVAKGTSDERGLVRDELDEISPEEAV